MRRRLQLKYAHSGQYLEEEVERCRDGTRAVSAPLMFPNVLRRPGIALNSNVQAMSLHRSTKIVTMALNDRCQNRFDKTLLLTEHCNGDRDSPSTQDLCTSAKGVVLRKTSDVGHWQSCLRFCEVARMTAFLCCSTFSQDRVDYTSRAEGLMRPSPRPANLERM